MNKILGDHKKQGKLLVTPFNDKLPMGDIHYIENILPEIIWIQLVINRYGLLEACEICSSVLDAANELAVERKSGTILFLSEFNPSDWEGIKTRIGDYAFEKFMEATHPLRKHFPLYNPFSTLSDAHISNEEEDRNYIGKAIEDLFYRHSQSASIAQSIIIYNQLKSGRLKLFSTIRVPDLQSIIDRFDSEEAGHASSFCRMNINVTHQHSMQKTGTLWAQYFWNKCRSLSRSEPQKQVYIRPNGNSDPQGTLIADFGDYSQNLILEVWSKMSPDIYSNEVYEVIGGLLTRQRNLAFSMVSNIGMWSYNCAPIFLRAMVDTHINCAWIVKDPILRSQKFIAHGLGQEKLSIEHKKAALATMTDEKSKEKMSEIIADLESWVTSQRYLFLQNVDLGSWSGINTREMAIDADCIDLYNHAYLPWSQAAHGMWNHIAKYDLARTASPFKKHMYEPNFLSYISDDPVFNACKYFGKTARLICVKFQIDLISDDPMTWVDLHFNEFWNNVDSGESRNV